MDSNDVAGGRAAGEKRAWACVALLVLLAGVPARAQQAPAEYVIGVQDVLSILVFGQPEMSRSFTVAADGAFNFPLIGRVSAGGLTIAALEAELTKRLADGFLIDPQVSVMVEGYRSQQVFITGEVRQPGAMYLAGPETLIQVLARAGSTTPNAAKEVLIIRPRDGSKVSGPQRPDQVPSNEVMRVDLEKLQTGTLERVITLQHGDTVHVPTAESVFVLGQVRSPGAYPLAGPLTVLQVLSLAGGVTDRGATGRVKIIRIVDGEEREIDARLSDLVQPRDTVRVPERFF